MASIRFSQKELIHLFVSVVVMAFLVGINLAFSPGSKGIELLIASVFAFPIAFLIIVPAFVLHELGHKVVAQRFGFWAEYRMWTQGLLLAILIMIVSLTFGNPFLFVAPGAVYFAANYRANSEKVGKIGLVGPVINIVLGVVFGLAAIFVGTSGLSVILAMGAKVNAFLAIFNLIPFPPFDGEKVFGWDKKLWLLAIAMAIVLFTIPI
ncbi:TPA: site-2 protease family protein [archaeon]|nr:site-2 protease family protein [Candidatus Naiadarchaeales archaeon SRR2090159.bin1288]